MARAAGDAAATTGRLAWLEPTKGAAMVMVVGYHVTLYLQSAGVDAVLGRARAAFELFPMPAFFLLTGMFAARHARYSFRALWRRRLSGILYLYVLWSVLRSAFTFLVPGMDAGFGELAATPPPELPLILVWPRGYWFLYALFVFTLLRWLIAGLPVRIQVAGACALSTLFTTGLVDTGNLGWNRVGALFVFFVLGAVFSRQIRDLVARAGLVHLAIAVAAFGGVSLLILLGLRWVPLLVLAGQLAAVAAGILVCARPAGRGITGLLAPFGVSSLKIYLLHLYLVAVAVSLIRLLEPEWPRWIDVAVQLTLTAVAVVGSLFLSRLTSRVRWLYLPPAFLRRHRERGNTHAEAARRGRRSGMTGGDTRQEASGPAAPVAPPRP